ncbi:hypothetical protein C8R43DRAFT_1137081 [Mycena crocata]|nr:hypothetical protein C8R43DRAFT_1137081 [Mycena crocata]
MSQIAPASTVHPSASPSDVTSNPLDGAQGGPPRATAALTNTPTVIISEGSVGDLDSIPPKDKERRNATPVRLRVAMPESRSSTPSAEARANQRELHALAQGMARHVSTAERHWEEITSVLDGFRNDILGVQMSLAEHGVADAAKNPVHLSLAIANDPLIQQLVADARSDNHRFVQLENARQSDQQRLAQVEESALDLQRKILDRLDRLEAVAAAPAVAPSALPQIPTPDSRAVRHHLDDSFAPAAAASPSPQETVYMPGAALPAGISAASAPATFTHAPAPAPAFTNAPPAFLHPVSSAPPAGITYAAPVPPPGIAQAFPQVVAHTPTAATSTPPPGIVHAGDAAARGRNNQPVAPRNPAAEVYLGPWDWVKDITKQASAIMRTVLPKQDLRNAFERAHRYGPQYIACAFKTPEQAAWFIDAFNAARVSVRGYESLSASAFPK